MTWGGSERDVRPPTDDPILEQAAREHARSESALTLVELTDHGRRLLANICADHLSSYRCTTEERRLCERIIKAAP